MEYVPQPDQVPCGPTDDEAVCACGCSGYDERCDFYMWHYDAMKRTPPSHTCAETNPKAQLRRVRWVSDPDVVMTSTGQQVRWR